MISKISPHRHLVLFLLSFLVYFFSWFLVYKVGINDTLIQSEDTLPALFLPASLALEGNFDLDEYFELLVSKYPQPDGARVPFYLEEVDEHLYSAFTVISPILAVPIYFFPLRLGLPVTFQTIGLLGHLSASLIVAASVAILYRVFRLSSVDRRLSTILSLVYAFGTCSFGLSSQGMWQHGASQLMFSLVLYFLVKGLREPKTAVWAGLFLGLATLARPTGAVVVFILSIYFFKKYGWRQFVRYSLLGLIPLGLFLAIPGASTGVLAGYGSQVGSSWTAPFPGGFLGLWFSTSKGVLTYSPVFIFSLVSIWLLVKRKTEVSEEIFYWVFACVMAHSLVVGKWYSWYGGWAFGYRMMTDMLPFLVFLLVPFLKSRCWKKWRKLFYALAVYSAGIQLMGIGFYDGVWHNLYDGGSDLDWLFSVKNCEMLYYLRRIIGKIKGIPANRIW